VAWCLMMLGTLVDGDVGAVCTQGTPNMEESKGESRVFIPPKGLPFCPMMGFPSQHVCSGAYQGRSIWRSEEVCWQAGAPTSSAQARPESIREGSRGRNIPDGARHENIPEHSGTFRNIPEHSRIEHRDRSRCKINNEDIQRGSSLGQGLHTRSPRRSSSKKIFTEKRREQYQRGSSTEGFPGCAWQCD
jgi:hypothetical protein